MQLSVSKTILNLLPENARNTEAEEFYDEVISHIRAIFSNLEGLITTAKISSKKVEVEWENLKPLTQPYEGLEKMLKKGKLKEAIILLELFKSAYPENDVFLYNMGMAYSDLNELDEAVENLEKLLEIKPEHINGRVAYGVALMRKGENEKAQQELNKSLEQEENNPWAQRNLGACFMRLGRYEEALPHLKRAAELNPEDQRAWFGLGQAYEYNKDMQAADAAYHKTIDLDEYSEVAEQAKISLSQLAEKIFKAASPQTERMDGVMYCLDALQKFSNMPTEEIQKIGVEIAMVGMNGIKVNNPEIKYTLKSMPGKFTGLNLLCLEYVAFKQVAPNQDIGFDLSKEYQIALQLFKKIK